jgi:hypothetical protein
VSQLVQMIRAVQLVPQWAPASWLWNKTQDDTEYKSTRDFSVRSTKRQLFTRKKHSSPFSEEEFVKRNESKKQTLVKDTLFSQSTNLIKKH